MVQADTPLPVYAQQRRIFDDVMAAAMRGGDDPAVVAKVIVAAATDPKPKLRYHRRPDRRTRQRAAPHRPRPDLRQEQSASSTAWPPEA